MAVFILISYDGAVQALDMESQNCLMILIFIILGGYVIMFGGYVIIFGD